MEQILGKEIKRPDNIPKPDKTPEKRRPSQKVEGLSPLLDQFREVLGESFNEEQVKKIIKRGSMRTLGDLGAVIQEYKKRLDKASDGRRKDIQKELAYEIREYIGGEWLNYL